MKAGRCTHIRHTIMSVSLPPPPNLGLKNHKEGGEVTIPVSPILGNYMKNERRADKRRGCLDKNYILLLTLIVWEGRVFLMCLSFTKPTQLFGEAVLRDLFA